MLYRNALLLTGLSTDDSILYGYITMVTLGVLFNWWLRKYPYFFKTILFFKPETFQKLHLYTLQFSSEENKQSYDIVIPWYKKAVLIFVGLTVAFTPFYNFVETLRPETYYLASCCIC
ncbi:hypothetical protein [Ulvibacter antarcticus]|uniref:Uncharacterized protein n=1 Tax=Ulvibacter antarcticus TaxID=442714 RepID=A0A3L9Z2W3_9FLAO|nr:hypothetical protein [Ulvibacter antarcticus]RMA66490.1 hypothetical protein BXY75_0916 [Ulvibacter antarcticus]